MLRRVIAERIKGVQKFTGAELPILSQIALPGEVIEEQGFSAVELMQGLVQPPDVIKRLLGIPSFCWGTAKGDVAGTWYKVSFPKSLSSPSVTCVGNARSGNIITRAITRVSLTREEIQSRIAKSLGDWGVFNWMRDAIAYGLSFPMKWIYDIIVGSQIDQVEIRANQVIADFYQMTGIAKGIIITPMHIRNVTSSGFEFLSLGNTTCQWIAIGKYPSSQFP